MIDDFVWIFQHPYDVIVEFILRNSLFAIRFDRVKEGDPTSEINLRYLRNVKSVLDQIGLFLITFPVIILYPLMMFLSIEGDVIRRPEKEVNTEEQWFFLNGVMVNENWLDENCKYLEKRFNTGVTGILNRSYGLFWDLIEAIFERSFNIQTTPVDLTTRILLPVLRDNNVKTVKLIAHSQGTIVASLVVQKLFVELSYTREQDCLKKLEVYTFANVCRDFINPGGLVKRIEHYANIRDPIAKLGILNTKAGNRIEGNLFINERKNGGRGHLFNSFYSLNDEDYTSPTGVSSSLLNLPGRVTSLPIKLNKI